MPPPGVTGGWFGNVLFAATLAAQLAVWGAAWLGPSIDDLPVALLLALTVLPYLALAVLIVASILWTLMPDNRLGPWVVGLAVVAPVARWGPSWPASDIPAADDDLRMMTWNVQRLWGTGAGELEPTACVQAAVVAADPDLIALQEVTQRDLERLGKALPLDCVFTTYRDANEADDAGVAVCAVGSAWKLVRGAPAQYADREDWQYILGTFERGGQRLNVLSVHLHPYRLLADPSNLLEKAAERAPIVAAAQEAQTASLLADVASFDLPTIVAGDFNSTRDTPIHARMRSTLIDAWEAGAQGFGSTVDLLDVLKLRIDYIYSPAALPVIKADIPAVACSDHRPVVADLGAHPR